MQATSLGDVFSHPSFLTILFTILAVIANILVGVSILPKDVRKKRYKLHRYVYVLTIALFAGFIFINQKLIGNTFFNYAVLIYFLTFIPLSRRWNVTAHAIIASVGLVLLVGIAAFSIL